MTYYIWYEYLKLMSSSGITNNIQEYQALGFQITNLHNLAVKYDFPCLSFVQLNRDGITKESTDAVSGSDRLIWLCTSFSIFKLKSFSAGSKIPKILVSCEFSKISLSIISLLLAYNSSGVYLPKTLLADASIAGFKISKI